MLKASQAKHNGEKLWRIWEVKANGRTFHIDGQVHEHDSREWQVLEIKLDSDGVEESIWCDTVATKREGLELVQQIIEEA